MRMRAAFFLLPLLLTAILPEMSAGKDLLDIKAESLNPVGPVYPRSTWGQPLPASHPLQCLADGKTLLLREGESVGLLCSWSVNIVNSNTCWSMNTPYNNTWPGFFTYDGASFHPFSFKIAYGTALGTCTQPTGLGSPCFPDFWNTCSSSVTTHYPNSLNGLEYIPNGWGIGFVADKTGTHVVSCVVDSPKSFSDRYSSNNQTSLTIKVIARSVRVNPSSYHHCTNEAVVGGLVLPP